VADDPTLATRDGLAAAATRRRATRWAVATTALTGGIVFAVGAALGADLDSSLASFLTFGLLFGGTAGFLGAEVTRYRRCPRCGWQQGGRPGSCPDCGYDVASRPLWRCEEAHVAREPGICECGRRRQPMAPVDVRGPVLRALWLGAAVLVALVVTGLIVE
jgi:hypothetical protein